MTDQKCEIDGCDNAAEFYDEADNKMCTDCVEREHDESGTTPDQYERIEDAEAATEEANGEESVEAGESEVITSGPSALTIFEENLTAEGLAEMQEEAKLLPVKATNKTEFDTIYEAHNRFKRLSVAIRKKAKELQVELKEKFTADKFKIAGDLEIILNAINPIIEKLADSRSDWDDEQARKKQEKADAIAAKQKAEFERQQAIKRYDADWTEAHAENQDRDDRLAEDKRLKAEAERQEEERVRLAEHEKEQEEERVKLDRERYEFECEKTRLGLDEAWVDAHAGEYASFFISKHVSDSSEQIVVKKGVSVPYTTDADACANVEASEYCQCPKPTVMTFTGDRCDHCEKPLTEEDLAFQKAETAKSHEQKDMPEAIKSMRFAKEPTIGEHMIPHGSPEKNVEKEVFSYSPDSGLQWENDNSKNAADLLLEDKEDIDFIKNRLDSLLEFLSSQLTETSFASQTTTAAVYVLNETIKSAAADFAENFKEI